MSIEPAMIRVANNIDSNLGWQAASYFHRQRIIDDRQYKMVEEFGRLEQAGYVLSGPQQHARREINKQILNRFSDNELFNMGIDVDALTIAENGWRHEYSIW